MLKTLIHLCLTSKIWPQSAIIPSQELVQEFRGIVNQTRHFLLALGRLDLIFLMETNMRSGESRTEAVGGGKAGMFDMVSIKHKYEYRDWLQQQCMTGYDFILDFINHAFLALHIIYITE